MNDNQREPRKSFVFYKSFLDAIRKLPKEEQLDACMSILSYGIYGEEAELEGVAEIIFDMAKPLIDANYERYENGKKGAKYGKLGGRPKKAAGRKKDAQPKEKPEEVKAQESAPEEERQNAKTPKEETRPAEEAALEVKAEETAPEEERQNAETPEEERQNADTLKESLKKVKPARHKFGIYKHVLLSDEELERLIKDKGEEKTTAAIQFLDEYIERKGYKCQNYNLTLRKWVFDALREEEAKERGYYQKNNFKNFPSTYANEDFDQLEAQLVEN